MLRSLARAAGLTGVCVLLRVQTHRRIPNVSFSTFICSGDTINPMNGIRNYLQNNVFSKEPRSAVSLLRAFLIGVGMALAWGLVSGLFHLDELFSDTAVRQMFSRPLPYQIVFYGVVSPLAEELLFRLILFDLVRKVVPERVAALIVAALFALWHGNIIQMLYAFPAGLILQYLRKRSGGMEEPVLCHIGANLASIIVSALVS